MWSILRIKQETLCLSTRIIHVRVRRMENTQNTEHRNETFDFVLSDFQTYLYILFTWNKIYIPISAPISAPPSPPCNTDATNETSDA